MPTDKPSEKPVTITIPASVAAAIDRVSSDRERFVTEAVMTALGRGSETHPESLELAEVGLDEWLE